MVVALRGVEQTVPPQEHLLLHMPLTLLRKQLRQLTTTAILKSPSSPSLSPLASLSSLVLLLSAAGLPLCACSQ